MQDFFSHPVTHHEEAKRIQQYITALETQLAATTAKIGETFEELAKAKLVPSFKQAKESVLKQKAKESKMTTPHMMTSISKPSLASPHTPKTASLSSSQSRPMGHSGRSGSTVFSPLSHIPVPTSALYPLSEDKTQSLEGMPNIDSILESYRPILMSIFEYYCLVTAAHTREVTLGLPHSAFLLLLRDARVTSILPRSVIDAIFAAHSTCEPLHDRTAAQMKVAHSHQPISSPAERLRSIAQSQQALSSSSVKLKKSHDLSRIRVFKKGHQPTGDHIMSFLQFIEALKHVAIERLKILNKKSLPEGMSAASVEAHLDDSLVEPKTPLSASGSKDGLSAVSVGAQDVSSLSVSQLASSQTPTASPSSFKRSSSSTRAAQWLGELPSSPFKGLDWEAGTVHTSHSLLCPDNNTAHATSRLREALRSAFDEYEVSKADSKQEASVLSSLFIHHILPYCHRADDELGVVRRDIPKELPSPVSVCVKRAKHILLNSFTAFSSPVHPDQKQPVMTSQQLLEFLVYYRLASMLPRLTVIVLFKAIATVTDRYGRTALSFDEFVMFLYVFSNLSLAPVKDQLRTAEARFTRILLLLSSRQPPNPMRKQKPLIM
ncbi:hypothetical protein ADUPG1_008477 [Aduncisulcus paluster]|uniref:VPS9 domain-containing protein n=1 Tax=Aduncisulcus paluster TaxID=2918883 RepID=A0ABQ5KV25_9EUKA|nr:hypothetical protein ADUPG1_008477 [Aduncisulcus paluster]